MECQTASYEHGLPPEPLIIRRKATRSVDLSHFGMGDRRTLVLSRGLQVLPDVDTVRVLRVTSAGTTHPTVRSHAKQRARSPPVWCASRWTCATTACQMQARH